MELLEWSINYAKNRDLLKKELVDVKAEKDTILFEYKDRKNLFVLSENLDAACLSKMKEDIGMTIVCLNTKKNVDTLAKDWDSFAKHKELMVIFVNPKVNEKWSIKPYVHNLITDKPALKTGLKSLFENVPAV